MKYYIKTYGCQMNERDSGQVAQMLEARGFRRVAHESDADVILLNTCSVRDMAEQAKHVIVATESDKFLRSSVVPMAIPGGVHTVVTDIEIPKVAEASLTRSGVNILKA